MKVVALLSGGKDSCYSILHAIANGYDVVAIASLTPQAGTDELDSYIYQTVGVDLVPLISQALRKPLYQRVISGKPIATALTYGAPERGGRQMGTEGDETEDLYELLREVISAHPEVDAVCSGAILSNYQRTRIEHVTQRLSLTSLSFLWQRPEAMLVDEMVAAGMVPVIIKVAGLGLKVSDVGKTLAELRPRLGQLEATYGCHVAGEGGEYETTTIDCPLFHERVQFDDSTVIVTDPSPVAYLRVSKASLQPKEDFVPPTPQELRQILRIDEEEVDGMSLWDEDSRSLLQKVQDTPTEDETNGDIQTAESASSSNHQEVGSKPSTTSQFARQGPWFAVSVQPENALGCSLEEEVAMVFEAMLETLKSNGLTPIQIQHQNFFLADMSDFQRANSIYSSYFGTSPPSRACVAVSHLLGQRVGLEAVGYDDSQLSSTDSCRRTALHVQSLSYWAPANIGPYSQAVTVGQRLSIAGQIGLIPSTLQLPAPQSFRTEAVLSLQHVRRIVTLVTSPDSTGGGWTGWLEGVICWLARPGDLRTAREVWNTHAQQAACEDTPLLFVCATELPKGALVEWQCNMHTGRVVDADERGESGEVADRTVSIRSTIGGMYEEVVSEGGRTSWLIGGYTDPSQFTKDEELRIGLRRRLSTAFSVRAYVRPDLPRSNVDDLLQHIGVSRSDLCITVVPSSFITDRDGRSLCVAFVVMG